MCQIQNFFGSVVFWYPIWYFIGLFERLCLEARVLSNLSQEMITSHWPTELK